MATISENGREGEGTSPTEVEADAPPDPLKDELAAIDAVLDRAAKVLEGKGMSTRTAASRSERPAVVYDLDWNEDERLAEWQAVVVETRELPAVLGAAILLDAWSEIEVLQHAARLGPLLVAAQLRQAGLAIHHLPCLHLGAKDIPRERRKRRNRRDRLLAFLDVIHEMALAGLKEHDQLVLAKNQMERRLRNRRVSSKLPDLVELVLSRPLASTKHDPGNAEGLAPRCTQPGRRARPTGHDREGEVSRMGNRLGPCALFGHGFTVAAY